MDGSLPNIISTLTNPYLLAQGSVDVVEKLLNGENVERHQLAPVKMFYDADTASEYYDTSF